MRVIVALLLLSGAMAHAHKVVTFYYVSGSTIEGQVGFSNGDTAPVGTAIDVLDKGEKITTIQTGADGLFSYSVDTPKPLTFYADMGAGHVAQIKVTLADFGLTGSESLKRSEPILMDAAQLEKALIKHIVPLRKDIKALSEKRRLMDIVGGLGFILGLFGCFAWYRSRQGSYAR